MREIFYNINKQGSIFQVNQLFLRSKIVFTGVSFPRIEKNAEEDVIRQIPTAMDIFARGVEAFLNDPKQVNNPLISYLLFVIKSKD